MKIKKKYIFNDKNELLINGKTFYFLEEIHPYKLNKTIDKDKIKYYRDGKRLNLVKSLLNDHYTVNNAEDIKFCQFKLVSDNITNKSGVYIWVLNNKIIYIGEASNLKSRFNSGYGIISPRNIFTGGQSTNCKMNRVVLDHHQEKIKIYFYETEEHKDLERKLLDYLKNEGLWKELYNSRL